MRKNKIIYYFIGLSTWLSLFACSKESPCFKSTGKIISENRIITNEITSIDLKDNIDLVIRQDSIASIKIEAGENLLPFIKVRQKGNQLELKNDNQCNFLRSYKNNITAYLSLPNIEYIYYTGHGNISTTGALQLNNFTFETRNGTGTVSLQLNANKISILQHTGPVDFELNGTSHFAYLFSGGGGWMRCQQLISDKVHVNHDGTGDVIVSPTNELLIELTSLGNIEYYGNPTLTVSKHSGSGKIIKR